MTPSSTTIKSRIRTMSYFGSVEGHTEIYLSGDDPPIPSISKLRNTVDRTAPTSIRYITNIANELARTEWTSISCWRSKHQSLSVSLESWNPSRMDRNRCPQIFRGLVLVYPWNTVSRILQQAEHREWWWLVGKHLVSWRQLTWNMNEANRSGNIYRQAWCERHEPPLGWCLQKQQYHHRLPV